jgi:hypothetical protein
LADGGVQNGDGWRLQSGEDAAPAGGAAPTPVADADGCGVDAIAAQPGLDEDGAGWVMVSEGCGEPLADGSAADWAADGVAVADSVPEGTGWAGTGGRDAAADCVADWVAAVDWVTAAGWGAVAEWAADGAV